MNLYGDFGLFIEGRWSASASNATRPVIDPANEKVIGTIPDATEADLARAVASAQAGFRTWRKVQPWDRAKALRSVADLLRDRIEDLATIMVEETGKPRAEALGEWGATADQFEWHAEEAKRIYGHTLEGRQADVRLSVIFQPVGVVAAFSAWNFPALLPARKIAAALAAGCSIILKPAGEAPGSAMAIVKACADAGIPDGTVNLVTGDSAAISKYLITSSAVAKISLTGSVPVGKQLMRLAAEGMKKVSMELGGHAPVIVFADSNPQETAMACAAAKFRNAGQVCISPSRFYVHESIYQPFVDSFVESARRLQLGHGRETGVTMGPMASQRGQGGAKDLVADALTQGAELLSGGRVPAKFNHGFFFEPTVLGRVPDCARIMRDEPFAPIAPIATFTDYDEVIARANNVPFGLAGYVFSRDLRLATKAAEDLETGMVGVNDLLLATAEAPFGGIKESGMGREGGMLGIRDYLEAKYIKTRL
ncbi:NAD-dependent succinate-semialdehyde dehydrogenase [Mesorhizobium sp. SB112]|uniref:NAD-dependent succinate-semialdehyde dehydrogenase n=1 Tax=Mesorhizobium sp. SB112 TaxID=3151853 RepID=UPI003267C30C